MFWQILAWIWASPTTFLALLLGGVSILAGAKVRRVGHTVEFYGGLITWLLKRTPIGAAAMTLGHVIIGLDAEVLDRCREHEWVHVRQYERWGPLFLPAYLGCSLYLWLVGRDAYRENPFEVEAYESDRRRAQLESPCDGE
ncbi:MAG: hypothetical protein KDA88_19240 [Planctomycetaceae bacterium]|nr:hypothetical protein [Planctomycetaceae bacterium]MCB9951685.1 hypothetical protein [Planctomycetaceae bacterium]